MKDIFVVFRYLWLERYEKLKTYNELRELEDERPKTSTKGNTRDGRFSKQMTRFITTGHL